MLQRFKDPALRARIVAEAEEAMAARFGGPQGVYMPSTKRELTDVMKELGVSGGEALVRVLEQDNAGAILRFGIEDDLIKILQHPTTSIACDCGAAIPGRATHPRYYGTFPRVLGRYTRDTKALTWPAAIRKMTLLPAATIGMVDRGAIAAGMAADITVFDPTTVLDQATFEEPTLPSIGIRHVLVNGTLALRDGKVTGARAGRALYRTKHMPSRALNNFLGSQVALTGSFPMIISQGGGQRAAMGTFRFTDPQTHVTVESIASALGILQATADWASFTARARIMPADEERTVVMIVEGKNPWESDRATTVIVAVDGLPEMRAKLPPGSAEFRW
jgi:hypothetical protein